MKRENKEFEKASTKKVFEGGQCSPMEIKHLPELHHEKGIDHILK